MKAIEIYKYLDQISPFAMQESWDNSGLLLDASADCKQLIIALDIDDELTEALPPNSCVLIHHPLIFKPLKTLASGHEARLLLKLASKNCALICAHTNFDKSHLNDYLCEQIFGFNIKNKDEFIAYCDNPFKSFKELAGFVKHKLNLNLLRGVDTGQYNSEQAIAVCCGAGASMASNVYDKACVYLTGDIKYHDALAAKLNALNMLDITHFASEKCFEQAAFRACKGLPIEIIINPFSNPFVDI